MTAPATIPPRAPSARPMASKPVATPRAVPIPIPTISHTPAKRSCKAFISPPPVDIWMISSQYLMSSWEEAAKSLHHRGHGEHRDLEESLSVSSVLSVVKDKTAQT